MVAAVMAIAAPTAFAQNVVGYDQTGTLGAVEENSPPGVGGAEQSSPSGASSSGGNGPVNASSGNRESGGNGESAGNLPFTGLDVTLLLLMAGALVSTGVVLRRSTRSAGA